MKISEFKDWKEKTTLMSKDEQKAEEWFEKNKEKYTKIYNNYWKRFLSKSSLEKSERTIELKDGFQ